QPRSRNPMLVAGISFAVVLVLGIILLLVMRGRSAQAPAPPPAPSPSGQAPGPGPSNQGLASVAPETTSTAPGGPMRVAVKFDAPPGTVIQQGDLRFAPGVPFRVLPGAFAFEYRCPGAGAPIATSIAVKEGRLDTLVIPIRCGLGR
ncbi:MAG TPA: hypothetical protein VFB81_15195, partial [Myxococcales bacterium]|nr:hypothetical protein [Myxococcales bacterium]